MTAAILLAAAAARPAPGLKVSARLGINGFSAEEGWNYVIVDLANSGPDAACELRMPIVGLDTAVYARRVKAPRGSHKRVFLYFRPAARFLDSALEAWLPGDDAPAHESRFTIRRMNATAAAAVIGRPVGLASHLLTLKGDAWRACPIAAQDAPDHWAGYTLFDAVVLSNCEPTRMSAAQQTALVHWVKAGGKLVLPGGLMASRLKGSALAALCPFGGATRFVSDRGALAKWCQAKPKVFYKLLCIDAQPAFGSCVLEADGRWLAARVRLGLGWVCQLAFDPSDMALQAWPDRGRFWGKLLGVDFTHRRSLTRNATAMQTLGQLLAAGVRTPLWAYFATTLFVGVYALMLGPVAYVVIKRGKRHSLWAAMLVCTVGLFSLLAYHLRYWLRGAQTTAEAITIVDVPSDLSALAGRSYVSVFRSSPVAFSLRLEPADGVASLFDRSFALGRGAPLAARRERVEFVRAPGELTVRLAHPVWCFQGWSVRWARSLPRGSGADGVSRVMQALGGRLDDCYVLTRDKLVYIGDLEAGSLAWPLRERLGAFGRLGPRLERDWVCERGRSEVWSDAARRRLRLLRLSFAEAVVSQTLRSFDEKVDGSVLSLRRRLDRGQAYLFGWASRCPLEPTFVGINPSLRSMVLVRIEIPPGGLVEAAE